MSRSTAVAIAWLVGLAAPPPAGACPGIVPTPLAAVVESGATLPADGAVVMVPDKFNYQPAPGDDIDAVVQLTPGAGSAKLVARELARGLVIYPLAARRKAARPATLRLTDGHRRVRSTFQVGPAAGPVVAPQLERATSDTTTPTDAPGGTSAAVVTVELHAPPPADAYGLVVYGPGAATTEGLSWIDVRAGHDLTYTLRTGGKACGGGPAAIVVGAKLSFAWLTRDGRLSPRSPAIELVAP